MIENTMDKKPLALLSIDTKLIFDRLCAAQVGETVTYDEMTSLIGRNARTVARYCVESARRKALHEKHMVFGSVSSVGLKRLADVEIVATGEDTVGRIRRISKRALRRITSVQNYDALPNDAKVRHNTYASMFGAVAHLSGTPQVKRLTETVAKAQAQLPLQKTLEAFNGAVS